MAQISGLQRLLEFHDMDHIDPADLINLSPRVLFENSDLKFGHRIILKNSETEHTSENGAISPKLPQERFHLESNFQFLTLDSPLKSSLENNQAKN